MIYLDWLYPTEWLEPLPQTPSRSNRRYCEAFAELQEVDLNCQSTRKTTGWKYLYLQEDIRWQKRTKILTRSKHGLLTWSSRPSMSPAPPPLRRCCTGSVIGFNTSWVNHYLEFTCFVCFIRYLEALPPEEVLHFLIVKYQSPLTF